MPVDPRAMSIELAVKYHHAGEFAAAEQIYRSVLRKDFQHVDANYLLGLLELDRGRFTAAVLLIERSRDQVPNNPLYHYNLGRALQGEGKFEQAEDSYRKAIHHRHDYPEARYALGHMLQMSNNPQAAIIEYKKLLRINPSLASVYNNLGNALAAVGRAEEGLQKLQRAVELEPEYAEGWGNLGNMLFSAGQLDEAVRAFEKALELDPKNPAQLYNYANLKQMTCDYDGAVELFLKATHLDPNLAGAFNNLGNVYKLLGKLKLAKAAFATAIEKNPEAADPLNNLGTALISAGEIPAAIESFRKAVALEPGHFNAYSNLVYAMNYVSDMDEQEIAEEHKEWSRRFEWPVEVRKIPKTRPAAGRKLRIGYVSGDFRRHSVAFFFEPLLEAHDRSRFSIYCYANIRFTDDVTQRIMNNCDHWRPINGLDDNQAAQLIRKDQIDVLIDLSGHTDGNRLLIFARHPAPVQVTWLGYPNTTGTNGIDYRMVDEVTDPQGIADELASENLYRLPRGFLCYRGYENAPFVLPPPSIRKGFITFGSFNNLTKVTHEVIKFWAEILHTVDASCLLMKTNQLEDEDTREKYFAWFEELGIARDRIDLRARTADLADHLSVYGEVDIALDTFPYNGTTTTCEALWMGVPVVALDGNSHRSRVSKSILVHTGLAEWIAADQASMIKKIQEMIADPENMRTQRIAMRRKIAASELCDPHKFAQSIEEAYLKFFSALD